jgi:hypothetical protein
MQYFQCWLGGAVIRFGGWSIRRLRCQAFRGALLVPLADNRLTPQPIENKSTFVFVFGQYQQEYQQTDAPIS